MCDKKTTAFTYAIFLGEQKYAYPVIVNGDIKRGLVCGISTIVGYLMPNPVYSCILDLYDL